MSNIGETNRRNWPKIGIVVVVAVLIIMLLLYFSPNSQPPLKTVTIKINNTTLQVEEAISPIEQQKGLSGRSELKPDHAMLFIFPTEAYHSFWMSKMKFPIDVLWLDKHGQVVYQALNVAPCTPTNCTTYIPMRPAKYVLETVAGFAQKENIKLGTMIPIPAQ